ncbi:unnamed protein product [Didymodactylos carnosus]|uniref:Uncharacterized protein n=1 Tax=Didymodactylos carnosus TaxID=1234261 RepID=A0A8S2HWL9_9BILA|nr:unnamed protein product [Didymodactylos carnosus]CAF3686806.1 unnamed protein product [Didymodactylos carnosus]
MPEKKKLKLPTKWLLSITKSDKKSIQDGKEKPLFIKNIIRTTDIRTKPPKLPFFAPLSPSSQRCHRRRTKRRNEITPEDIQFDVRKSVQPIPQDKNKLNTLAVSKHRKPRIRKQFHSDEQLLFDAIPEILEPTNGSQHIADESKFTCQSNQDNDFNMSNRSIVDYPLEERIVRFEHLNNEPIFSSSSTAISYSSNIPLNDEELNECFNTILRNSIAARSISQETLSTLDGLSLVSYEQQATVSNDDLWDSGHGSSPSSNEHSRHSITTTNHSYYTTSRSKSVDSLKDNKKNVKKSYTSNTQNNNSNLFFVKRKSVKSSIQQQQKQSSINGLEKSGLTRVSASLYKLSPTDDDHFCENSINSFCHYCPSNNPSFTEELPRAKTQYHRVVADSSSTNVTSEQQHHLLLSIKNHINNCFSAKTATSQTGNSNKKQNKVSLSKLSVMQELSEKLHASVQNTVYAGFERELIVQRKRDCSDDEADT